ncbi:uncharacterized protein LOC123674105 [Harmonia axyridis]|uniref:uncharacterized protein LOC123674105 n=1 Tax=Harmonia axyridis TaxID=115357 RepID=UPI001E274F2B|nr:uncharacterized protein LOC123674105 [Harmonia axyridis]
MGLRHLFMYYTLNYVSTVSCLQITDLFVPSEATDEAVLDCRYSLEWNETLYDVKWYKDGSNFFRCQPDGKITEYPVDGVNLLSNSESAKVGSCTLKLIELTDDSTGEYNCEVTLDFPFHQKIRASHLQFVNVTSNRNDSLIIIEGSEQINAARKSTISVILIFFVLLVNIFIKN